MRKSITPIFVFSLPRSGSTLLQRVLSTHDDVASASEPWLLLPFLYATKKDGMYAEYGHYISTRAVSEFVDTLQLKHDDYYRELSHFVKQLYSRSAKNQERYFLDKTPRYHLIIDEIFELFPDAKFIFLWRNPLSIIASMVETFNKGKWRLYYSKIDLYKGINNLLSAYEANIERSISVCYEDLVSGNQCAWQSIFKYLEIPYCPDLLKSFNNTKLVGSLGDPKGVKEYSTLSKSSLESWKEVIKNPLRKRFCQNYLDWLGAEHLALMGYDKKELVDELNMLKVKSNSLASDIVYTIYGYIHTFAEPQIMKRKIKLLPEFNQVYFHE